MTNTTQRNPKRNEIPVDDTWDLSSLYPDDAAWLAALSGLEQCIDGFAPFAGTLADSVLAQLDKHLNGDTHTHIPWSVHRGHRAARHCIGSITSTGGMFH